MKYARRLVRAAVLIALGAMAAGSSACGYALAGRSNTLPSYIRRIGIPEFLNQAGQPDLDRVLTDAVRVEFSGRGKYTVLPQSSDVDGLLTCTITGFSLVPQDFNSQTHQATSYKVVVTANVEFHDLTNANKTLWANPALRFEEPYSLTNGQLAVDPTTDLRNNSDAMDRLAKNFARNVVTSILESF